MKTYALILGLDTAERDELVRLLAAPDLAHLKAALMELPAPPPVRPWWDQATPYPARASKSPLTVHHTAGGPVLRTLTVTWELRVLAVQVQAGQAWLKVNDSPEMWARAEDCVEG